MDQNKLKLKTKRYPGKGKVKHGGFSYLSTGKTPNSRKYITKYLTVAREGLIRDLGDGKGEESLSAAQIILIDRLITKLGVIRCMEEHIRETSVMKGDQLAPCLKGCYLAYNNSIRLDLQLLGIRKKAEDVLDSAITLAERVDKGKR